MITEELKIPYPPGFEMAVHLTKMEMEQHLRLMAALKMFELGKISSGKAAELAGMSRPEFFEACGRYHVSIFNYSEDEIEEELNKEYRLIMNFQDKETAVLELYRQGKISSGKAAEILGMEKFEFIDYSAKKGIPFIRISPEELEEEIRLLENL